VLALSLITPPPVTLAARAYPSTLKRAALTLAALETDADVAALLAAEELAEEARLLPELLLAELAVEVLAALEEAAEAEDCCGVLTAEVLLSLPPPPPPQANSENDAMVDNNAIHSVLLLLMMLPLLSALAIMAGHG